MLRYWDRRFAKRVDELSHTSFGICESDLMNSAGRAVASEVKKELNHPQQKIVVLCGPGNNGGDGFVCARALAEEGFNVCAVFIGDPSSKISEACARERALCKEFERSADGADISSQDFIVDAVFGLGFSGKFRTNDMKLFFDRLKRVKFSKVIAVDLPSGLDCDCKEQSFDGLSADKTITFGGRKPAHAIYPWSKHCGEVITHDIGFSSEAIKMANEELPALFTRFDFQPQHHAFDDLGEQAHKFERGHVLVIGGSKGKCGAPLLAAQAALRSGAGWVSVATDCKSNSAVPLELTYEDLIVGGKIDIESLEEFLQERKVAVVLLGPGTVDSFIDDRVAATLQKFTSKGGRVCLDAAATRDLGRVFSDHPLRSGSTIALPHPGEWLKANAPSFSLDEKGLQVWRKWEESTGVKLVYKSSTPTWLQNDTFVVGNRGHRALSKAGSGDILAGIVAAQLLQKNTGALDYAFTRFYHATSRALKTQNEHNLVPSDLLSFL